MALTTKHLWDLTAGDLMSPDFVLLRRETPLQDAACLLSQSQAGGAPVVGPGGKCVGVFSSRDFLRLVVSQTEAGRPEPSQLPITCPFQVTLPFLDGRDSALCLLPAGACPLQVSQKGPGGEGTIVCSQPHCVMADWQGLAADRLPRSEVGWFMTADPVTVTPETPIRTLARLMSVAHTALLVVVDEDGRPVGVVSGTDLFTAMAYSGGEPEDWEGRPPASGRARGGEQ